jgi:DNA end-binding protein Ku
MPFARPDGNVITVARAIWSGSISFGLVSVPVKLFNATSPQDVRFHQFERDTGRRIRYRRVAEEGPPEPEWLRETPVGEASPAAREHFFQEPARDAGAFPSPSEPREEFGSRPEVPYEDLVKGYEVDRDEFVFLDPDELRRLRPEQTQTIEIEEFVQLAQIDPVHFEKSYYVAPKRGVGAEKPYALLVTAMDRAGKVAIGRFVLRTKEYLCAIRPTNGALMLETLFYADEVRQPADVDNLPVSEPVSDRELDIAGQLISLLETDWDPAQHPDRYRERVLELIRSRTPERVAPAATDDEAPALTKVPDLLEALRRSVEAAREAAEVEPEAKPATKGRSKSKRAAG